VNKEMSHVEEQLDEIAALLSKGFSETEIAHRLGVSIEDWQEYKRAHPGFKAKMSGVKEANVSRIHEIIWSLAQGYDYQDRTVIKKIDANGNETVSHITHRKHVPPNLDACLAMLKIMAESERKECMRGRMASNTRTCREQGAQVAHEGRC